LGGNFHADLATLRPLPNYGLTVTTDMSPVTAADTIESDRIVFFFDEAAVQINKCDLHCFTNIDIIDMHRATGRTCCRYSRGQARVTSRVQSTSTQSFFSPRTIFNCRFYITVNKLDTEKIYRPYNRLIVDTWCFFTSLLDTLCNTFGADARRNHAYPRVVIMASLIPLFTGASNIVHP